MGYGDDGDFGNEIIFREFNALSGYIEEHIATKDQMLKQHNIHLSSNHIEELLAKVEVINASWEEYKELAESLGENRWFESDSKAIQHLKEEGKATPFELAESLFPTTPGPFFGSQDYDSSYFYHVSDLLNFLNQSRDKWLSEDYSMVYSMHY